MPFNRPPMQGQPMQGLGGFPRPQMQPNQNPNARFNRPPGMVPNQGLPQGPMPPQQQMPVNPAMNPPPMQGPPQLQFPPMQSPMQNPQMRPQMNQQRQQIDPRVMQMIMQRMGGQR